MKRDGTLRSVANVFVVFLILGFILAHPELAFAAALTVNSIADTTGNDGECTLREAIENAINDVTIYADCPGGVYGDDTIQFSLSYPATISLASALPVLPAWNGELTIDGPGAADLTILSAVYGVRIFEIDPLASVRISGVRLEGGITDPGNGGGILNFGRLEIIDSVLYQNGARNNGGGLYNAAGGDVTITGSTFDENYAVDDGGGIYNDGVMEIANSTFSENTADVFFSHRGGAIYNNGTLTLHNATLNNNFPDNLYNAGWLDFANTILSGSISDCHNQGSIGENVNNLIQGWAAAIPSGERCQGGTNSIYDTDPQLAAPPPADNGGPTPTIALGPGSPAINAGDNTVCAGTLVNGVDQRGVARPQYGVCDIGAFEINNLVFSTTVDITDDTYDGLCVVGGCSLRDAVVSAASGGTVDFALSYPATITLADQITIDKDLILSGPGAANLTVSGGTSVRIFEVDSSASVTLSGLRLADGRANLANGAGILNNGVVEIRDSVFYGNIGDSNGGGLFNAAGATATIIGSTFDSNFVALGQGGGAYNDGTMVVVNSTFWQNYAWSLFFPDTGGIHNAGDLTIRNSTLSDNVPRNVYNAAGGTLDFANTILSGGENDCYNAGTIAGNTRNLIELETSPPANSCIGADTIYGADPQLATPPADNGGPTPTLALQAGSPAINTGDDDVCALAPVGGVDQRGISRPQVIHCDIGSFEAQNTSPVDISLSGNTIPENQPGGTLIGTLTTTDPDAGDTHSYNLQSGVSGCDDSGNGSFQIPVGTDQLQSADFFDYETPPTSFTICIRTTDYDGLTYNEAFTITVTDLEEQPPSISAFSRQTPATSPTNADVLVFRVTFDEDVQNVDAADFAVDGATTATVTGVAVVDASTYDVTVSGGNLASFNGDVGLNLGGSQNIEDLAGNPLPAGEPATDEVYTLDNTAPSLTAFSRHTPATSPTNADVLVFRATFDVDVQNVDAADFTVDGTTTAAVTGVTAVNASTYDITVSGGDLASFNGDVGLNLNGSQDIQDLVGNPLPAGEPATDEVYAVDNAAPSLTGFLRNTPATSPTNADVLVFRATFDEDVQNVNAADFTVDGTTTAAVTGVTAMNASTYDITVSGGDLASFNGDVGLNLNGSQDIQDLVGNPLPAGEPATDEMYAVDNVAPTVLVTSAAGDPTNTSPIPVTITFSSVVTGFDIGDLTVGNGTAGNFAGAGAVYTADITPAANGLVTVDVAAGAAVDGAGNGNTAAPQFTITYDTNFPTLVYGINTVPADNNVLPAGPTQILLEFSKDVVADGSANAANNPANYVLVEDGANNVFNTTGCAAVDPVNDTDVPVDAAAYDDNGGLGPFLATVDINGGTALGPGRYRLFVCGTTSIFDPAGNRLNGGADSLLTFTVSAPASVPATGFAPGRVTVLPPQTVPYTKLGDLWLEIPRLGVRADIVGVPLDDGEWNVTWLGSSAGWLEGTAFPTWAGNSVITAHVWDAYNRPGLFYGLDTLGWGDAVIVHAWGGKNIYAVRQVLQVRAADTAAMLKHEELPWLTLVTCKGYNAAADTYRYRLLVRAVLIEVQ